MTREHACTGSPQQAPALQGAGTAPPHADVHRSYVTFVCYSRNSRAPLMLAFYGCGARPRIRVPQLWITQHSLLNLLSNNWPCTEDTNMTRNIAFRYKVKNNMYSLRNGCRSTEHVSELY